MSQAQRHTMPHSTAPPHSAHGETTTAITHWFQSIKDVALPILPLTHHALQRQWLRSHGALNQLADIIAQDPVASLAVLRAANSTHPMHSTSEAIIGIHHCITYLGLENLQHLIAKTPILTASITQSSYVHYVNSLVRGLYAAFLAQDWARAQNHYQPEQLFLSALFYNAPYWALWRVAPAEMKIIEHLKLNEHIPAQEAETVVLGTSIAPLAATLAKYWRLPSVIQAAYDHTQLPHIKTILKAGQCCAKGQLGTWPNFDNHGVATHSTAVHVLLANWIAFESEISWHSRQLQRVTALASAFQHQSTARGQRGLWQQALAVSRAYALPNTSSPGSRLMTPRHTPTRRTRSPEHVMAYVKKLLTQRDTLATDTPVTASADQAIKNDIDTAYTAATTASHIPSPSRSHTPASRTPASQTPTSQTSSVNPPAATKPPLNTTASANIKDSQLFKDLYTRLRHHTKLFNNDRSVYSCLTEALREGIGLDRVIVLLLNDSKTHLSMHRLNQDVWETHTAQRFALSPTNLFTKLTQHPTTLWVNATDGGRMMTLVPATFKAITNSNDNFFISAIVDHSTPVAGIVYADDGEFGAPLPETHFKLFKILCNTASQRITQLHNAS